MKKLIIVDTSVLLYDKKSIHSFKGSEVVLPLVVLDELDTFKEKPGLLGESARYVNRFLDSIRKYGRLDQGVYLEEYDQTIKIILSNEETNFELDDRNDNLIIATALSLSKQENTTLKVITKDINLRVKCDALGLKAQDYFRDHILTNLDEQECIKNVYLTNEEIDLIYKDHFLEFENDLNLLPNSYCVLLGESPNKSALGFFDGNKLNLILDKNNKSYSDIKPKNKEQRFVLHALKNNKIPLVCLTGLAGSGKTFLTLLSGIDEMLSGNYERIIVTRNIEPVGKEIGFLPGDIKDKMNPWLSPLMDNFRHHFKDKVYFETMIDKGQIEIAPLSYIRGRTFSNSYLIVDEAQNATIHELKTIITRMGENSKIILMGDTDQIDTPYIDKKSNGLSVVIDRFSNSELMAHIHLTKGERSNLATVASKLL